MLVLTLGKRGEASQGGEVNQVSASDLIAAFGIESEAKGRVEDALNSGAHFHVGLTPIPASRLRGICQGRVRAAQRHDKPTIGVAECLAGLAEMGERGLQVVHVDDRRRAGYFFNLYLDPHPLKVIGCYGVNISPE